MGPLQVGALVQSSVSVVSFGCFFGYRQIKRRHEIFDIEGIDKLFTAPLAIFLGIFANVILTPKILQKPIDISILIPCTVAAVTAMIVTGIAVRIFWAIFEGLTNLTNWFYSKILNEYFPPTKTIDNVGPVEPNLVAPVNPVGPVDPLPVAPVLTVGPCSKDLSHP